MGIWNTCKTRGEMVVLWTINAIHNYNVQTKEPSGDNCTIMRFGVLIFLWNGKNEIFIKTTTIKTIAQNRKMERAAIYFRILFIRNRKLKHHASVN